MRSIRSRALACCAVAAMAALGAPLPSSDAATRVVKVSDATVDIRGYYGSLSATVTEGGVGVPGLYLWFEEMGSEGNRLLCAATTDDAGVARCRDNPWATTEVKVENMTFYQGSMPEIVYTSGQRGLIAYWDEDPSVFGYGKATATKQLDPTF